MGRELLCRAKINGKWTEGKALLETTEIIFRGEPKLKIALASLTSVTAKDGQLSLKWAHQSATIELGAQAEIWAHAILHPKTVTDKLGIKAGLTVSVLNMPADTTMSDTRKAASDFSDGRPMRNSDLIFYGATTASDLKEIKKLLPCLVSNGVLWIVYPKGQKDITEIQVLNAGRAAGLYDVKVVSYSATHTALKFVRPKDKR